MRTNFYLKPKNEAHAKAIVKRLNELGLRPLGDCTIQMIFNDIDAVYVQNTNNYYMAVKNNTFSIEEITLDDLYSKDFNKVEEITLKSAKNSEGK